MTFPKNRLHRLRKSSTFRNFVAEHTVTLDSLMMPLFVRPGKERVDPIISMPGIAQLSPDMAVKEVGELVSAGIHAIMLFGLPEYKDEEGSASWQDTGVVQETIRRIKDQYPQTVVAADLCFCEYTSHGHCGVMKGQMLDNDSTLRNIEKQAFSLAKAGADIIAPSGMIDGQVAAIRQIVDTQGYCDTAIMAYSAKYASAWYSPFRHAADCAPQFGDRKTYQMNPENSREAIREIELDIEEGADIVMIKPALGYLDILATARNACNVPLAVFNVSGEYSMVKAAAQQGWIDEQEVVKETLTCFTRAGADCIITYWAKQYAQWVG
ncbi:MAG: porphobilinogen synthase [bacterium]